MIKYWTWDAETYPNFFSLGFKNLQTGERRIFEISQWVDDGQELWYFLRDCQQDGSVFIGFNNMHFDYPILHEFLTLGMNRQVTYEDLYRKADRIIAAPRNDWTHAIWESDHLIPQIDVFKISHFDNFARSTSLKALEIAMRSASVVDLPYKPGMPLPYEGRKPMIDYMMWDIDQTEKYAKLIWDKIEFRQNLDAKYGGKTRINYNDTKIGKEHFMDVLRQHGVPMKSGAKRIQTKREEGVRVADFLIDPAFVTPSLQAVHAKYQNSIIMPDQTKGFFTGTHADVRGFRMDFGTGGIHGSVHGKTFVETDTHMIKDADISSMYPSIAIQYGYYPLHLGEQFLHIYNDMRTERLSYPKTAPESATLKLALNGTYGESNNKFSNFYDPQFTMAVTITGQMLLAKLAEMLMSNGDLTMIQMNTDGLTVLMPREHEPWYYETCRMWEAWARMELEYVDYAKMAVRDVNNYIAISTDGKIKHKGAYNPKPDWHQDHSSLVVQKAVSAFVVDGVPLQDTIYSHTDAYDFCLMVKTRRSDTLYWGDEEVQRTCRYFVCLPSFGDSLVKHMPPLAGSSEPRMIGVNTGWSVLLCNDMRQFDWSKLNRRWYLNEAKKLIQGLGL